jgi:hypothetical protein
VSASIAQGDLFARELVVREADDSGEDDSDSWCTDEPIVKIAHGFWPEGIALDPCTNRAAIALGYVRARTAWTIVDDCLSFPSWDVEPRTTCWWQPPYSRAGAPLTAGMVARWDAGQMHEVLALVKLDTSTKAWHALDSRASSLVLFHDRLAHVANGVRVDGSNFCSAMLLLTRSDPKVRHRALEAAVGELGNVYR